MEVVDLIKKSEELNRNVKEYILANPDWLYYFIPNDAHFDSKAKEKGKVFKEFILEYPDEWRDRIDLEVSWYNGVTAKVYITLDGDEECPPCYDRCIVLNNLHYNAKYNKMAMEGQLNEARINDLKDVISYHEEELQKAKEELEELTKSKTNE